jgi:hypothetical protein
MDSPWVLCLIWVEPSIGEAFRPTAPKKSLCAKKLAQAPREPYLSRIPSPPSSLSPSPPCSRRPPQFFLPPPHAPEGFPLTRVSQISPASRSSAHSQNPLPHRASPSISFYTTPPSTTFASCIPFASGCAAPSHQVVPPPHPDTSPAVEPPHTLTIPPQSIPSSKP